MRNKSQLCVTLIAFLLLSVTLTLKVEHEKTIHKDEAKQNKPTTLVENPDSNTSCSRDFCMTKYGLLPDPFDPHCDENATCWKEWFGFPQCKDDEIKCWKIAVGYPKNCNDDDYDCWIKDYGYASCEDKDSQCLKDYLNYSCKYDDLECWKTKTWLPTCKWNDWDCWVKDTALEWICNQKKGYDCVSDVYQSQCKQDDETCWRKALNLPDKDCDNNVECVKKLYYLPDCKDDDYECWKNLYWGPDCKKGDINCLKKFLSIPECSKEKDQVQCYKKWLAYPDCKPDDGKCWKDWNDSKDSITGSMYWRIDYAHKSSADKHHAMSFGKMMDHKRRNIIQTHHANRQFHMKRAGLIA